jgi:hypothetical protein
MRERNLTRIVVTCSDGVLTGVLRRADIALGVPPIREAAGIGARV